MVERLRLEQAETPEFLDAIHALLADSDRRTVLQYLMAQHQPVTVHRLATELAAAEYGAATADALDRQREIALGLRHAHLPLLQDAGVVDWNLERDSVALTPILDHLSVTVPDPGGLLDLSLSSRPNSQ
ncbi:DUF7344 domain-containing protein [Natrinema marinum]|uniref:DUF7344 domain-containing protein n=1 Tax=Natrinema marinum TaxID=2961598 RepID=UPI0020C92AA9|nr:hypothetical protein [Natrinema marinum]